MGSRLDDLVGCYTDLNLTYVYNGDDFDDGAFGYGSFPPAFGCTFLNKDMAFHQTFDETISNIDFKGSAYDYLSGKNVSDETFKYDGDPVAATGSLDTQPNDRTTLSSFGPYEFKAGTSICFNMAFVYARDKAQEVGRTDIVGQLKEDIAYVREYYRLNHSGCYDIYSGVDAKKKVSEPSLFVQGNTIRIEGLSGTSQMVVFDLNGRLVSQQHGSQSNLRFSTAHLPSGIYVVKVQSAKTTITQKLILPGR